MACGGGGSIARQRESGDGLFSVQDGVHGEVSTEEICLVGFEIVKVGEDGVDGVRWGCHGDDRTREKGDEKLGCM